MAHSEESGSCELCGITCEDIKRKKGRGDLHLCNSCDAWIGQRMRAVNLTDLTDIEVEIGTD